MIVCARDIETFLEVCPACNGAGTVPAEFVGGREECGPCEGYGHVMDADTVSEAMEADWDAWQELLAERAH